MEELLKKIDRLYKGFKTDADQRAVKGNKTAGTRSRTASLELGRLMKEWRALSIKD